LSLEDVFGDVDQHRTRTAGSGDVKRLVYDTRQVVDVLHQVVVLGSGARDAEGIGFLKRIGAHQLGGDLAGECNHGDRVHHGIHQSRDQVGGARPRGRTADANPARGTRVALGGEGGVLFVPHQNMANGVVVQRVVERQRDAAGIAEDAVYI